MLTGVSSGRVRFAQFTFDCASGELYRDGRRIRLQDQPAQVLAALLEQPGDIVSRDRLRERLWKAGTFVDYEHGLNTAVKKLRQALGDSAEAPVFIETLARRGYRFVGEVALLPDNSRPASATLSPERQPPVLDPPSPGPGWRRTMMWAVVAALVAAGPLVVWRAGQRGRLDAVAPARIAPTQLAVMPFSVLSEDREDSGYLGIGLADAITTRLAGTRRIGVRPTSAVLPFAGPGVDTAQAAAALSVEHLVVGTIQLSEQAYQVRVLLVRADGVAVWGHTYAEPRSALLDLQDRLAEKVVDALRVELAGPDRARLHVRYTNNPAAYDLYLRGRSLLVNYTEPNMRAAITAFEQALALDEHYALARTGIATACAWFSVRYAHESEAAAWAKRADEEARRALQEDAALGDAHFAVASAAGTAYGGFDWAVVLDRSAAALALDPSLDLAHLARMRAFYHLGLFDEAASEGRAAARLNPGHSVEAERLEVALQLFEGHFDQAIRLAEPLIGHLDFSAVPQYLGLARYYAGDPAASRAMLGSVMRRGAPDTRAQASLASIEAATGMESAARSRIAAILRGADLDHHVAYSLGAAFAQLRDPGASLTWLERAAETGFPCYPWFARDPLLDPLRSTPRFVQLLGRLETAHEGARRRRR
jgi:DNA-binding winged helix-turn-helix (wHTH) protein/TolB-like protein